MERGDYERIMKKAATGSYDAAMAEAKAMLDAGDKGAYEALSDINVITYHLGGERKYLSLAKDYLNQAGRDGIDVSEKKFSLLIATGDFAAAKRMSENETDEKKRLFFESLLMLEKQDVDGARKSLERLIAMEPETSEPYLVYAKVLYSTGEYRKAIDILRDAAERLPESFHKAELAREFERISTLYNAKDNGLLIGLFGIENNKWVLLNEDDFSPGSPEEFLGLIGMGMNESGHLMVVVPKDSSLIELVKDDFLGMMPEGIDSSDLEFMLAQLSPSIG